MCTIKQIREAIREDCRSQRNMESADIERILQTLPFSQGSGPFDRPPKPKPKRPYRCKSKLNHR